MSKEYLKAYYQRNRDKFLEKTQDRKKKYPWKIVYNSIKQRCTNPKQSCYARYGGAGVRCKITVEEVKELWFRDKAYDMWHPSIDREKSTGHYEFNNCRFIELALNVAERNVRVDSKPVLQYSLNGQFIKEWPSVNAAGRGLKMSPGTICAVCLKQRKSAHHFIWRYKDGFSGVLQ